MAKCPRCGTHYNQEDKFCTACGLDFSTQFPTTMMGLKYLGGFSLLFLVVVIIIRWIGFEFGIQEMILSLAPIIAWGLDVLLKWALGLSTRSSGADLSFGTFSASAAVLVTHFGKTADEIQHWVFAVTVLGFSWLICLIFGVVAEENPHDLSAPLAKLGQFVNPDLAMWYSIFMGMVSAIYVAYLLLKVGV